MLTIMLALDPVVVSVMLALEPVVNPPMLATAHAVSMRPVVLTLELIMAASVRPFDPIMPVVTTSPVVVVRHSRSGKANHHHGTQ